MLMKSNSFAVMMNLLGAVLLVAALVSCVANALTKSDFPAHFLFGASTSAYQEMCVQLEAIMEDYYHLKGVRLPLKLTAPKAILQQNHTWFLNPFIFGEYPDSMKKNAGSRLPYFTTRESNLVKGSIDFLGINFYYAFSVKNNPKSLQKRNRDFASDMAVELKLMMNLLGAVLLVAAIVSSVANALTKSDFPPHFLFGASTSAYQPYLEMIQLQKR
ncbi:hypothetical protein RYX36_011658 [Vicia faba]